MKKSFIRRLRFIDAKPERRPRIDAVEKRPNLWPEVVQPAFKQALGPFLALSGPAISPFVMNFEQLPALHCGQGSKQSFVHARHRDKSDWQDNLSLGETIGILFHQ